MSLKECIFSTGNFLINVLLGALFICTLPFWVIVYPVMTAPRGIDTYSHGYCTGYVDHSLGKEMNQELDDSLKKNNLPRYLLSLALFIGWTIFIIVKF